MMFFSLMQVYSKVRELKKKLLTVLETEQLQS